MDPSRLTFKSADKLLTRLGGRGRAGEREVVFLVGSALTMPTRTGPGVANVTAMLELIRERVRAALDDEWEAREAVEALDRTLAALGDPGDRYRKAFEELKGVAGPEAVNAVIRRAVLQARTVETPITLDDVRGLAELEREPAHWHLGPAVKALGWLVARHPKRFSRTVLTTNFDPLVELSIRAAGGQAAAVDLLGDAALGVGDVQVARVIHLHGLWRTDTLHTIGALTVERPELVRSLAALFEGVTLVVIGYGGWDDVLTEAIAELTRHSQTQPDVLWCFYESDAHEIAARYPKVLDMLVRLRERVVCYTGVDCHALLPKLRARIDEEHELLGRRSVCVQLDRALDGQQAVEILGERQMGRSSLLGWIAERAARRREPVACIRAAELAGSPVAFVRKVGEALGRGEAVERQLRRDRATPTEVDARRALAELRGGWILIDDAEQLAAPGHGFTEEFFAVMRAEVQDRNLRWISVARRALEPAFASSGLSSRFLNDAIRIHAGGLDRREVDVGLAARLGDRGDRADRADRAAALAGTLPALVYRLCDAEWGDVDDAIAKLGSWAEPLFCSWWERADDEREILRRAIGGLRLDDLGERDSKQARELCARGLLVETDEGYGLNGDAWEDHVRRQG